VCVCVSPPTGSPTSRRADVRSLLALLLNYLIVHMFSARSSL